MKLAFQMLIMMTTIMILTFATLIIVPIAMNIHPCLAIMFPLMMIFSLCIIILADEKMTKKKDLEKKKDARNVGKTGKK